METVTLSKAVLINSIIETLKVGMTYADIIVIGTAIGAFAGLWLLKRIQKGILYL